MTMKRLIAAFIIVLFLAPAACSAFEAIDSGASGDKVTALSLKLVDLGYIDEATDVYDEKLVSAVADFQTVNGLERTGNADEETLQIVYSLSAISRSEYLAALSEKYAHMTPDIADIQSLLGNMGYYAGPSDGKYNDQMTDAVKEYRVANGLDASGNIDAAMLYILYEGRSVTAEEALASGCVGTGDTGAGVRRVQKRLNELGYFIYDITGTFGYNTLGAVIRFQENNDLKETGVVDEETYRILFSDEAVPAGDYIMFMGTSGDDVFALQIRLKALGFLYDDPNGVFSLDTQTAVMLYSAAAGLPIEEEVSLELYETVISTDQVPETVTKASMTVITKAELDFICLRAQRMLGMSVSSPDEDVAYGYSILRNLFASIGLDTGSFEEISQYFEPTEKKDCGRGDVIMFEISTENGTSYGFAICIEDGSLIGVSPETHTVVKAETETVAYNSIYRYKNTEK